jgi:hypothetical protein
MLSPNRQACNHHRVDGVLGYAVYAAVKFVAYSAWCAVALSLAASEATVVSSAAAFGALRWLIGLGFGVVVFLVIGSIAPEAAGRLYFVVYTPVRVVEWGIMAFLIRGGSRRMTPGRAMVWCAGGILVSFASDLLSPDGLAGRFCVGRCLC